jgi:limonene-1,2-epoxide hydrolase
VVGKDGIRATINMFATGVERIEFRVDNIAADGAVVMTERVDIFSLSDGRAIELPVMGTFDVAGGKIAAWRDYFDLNQFMSQVTPG